MSLDIFINIYIGVILSLIIIGVWAYIGVLSFSLYSTTLTNHFQMRMFYTIAVLNVLQAMLGIYYIVSGNPEWQQARWTAFSLIDIAYLSFVLGTFKTRWLELVVRTIFFILVLTSVVVYNLWLSMAIALILICVSSRSTEPLIRKYFPFIFGMYAMTTLVPTLFGFTTNISLFTGVIYTIIFAYGAKKLYNKEKVGEEISRQLRDEIIDEMGRKKV